MCFFEGTKKLIVRFDFVPRRLCLFVNDSADFNKA